MKKIEVITTEDITDILVPIKTSLNEIKCKIDKVAPSKKYYRNKDLKKVFGLSDNTIVLTLYTRIGEPTDLTASIVPDLRPGREHAQTPVLCCRFDDLRRALGITSIGLIKIDVEGAELSVLHGMDKTLRELRAPILCEILYADATADILQYEERINLLINFIAEIEYTIFRVGMDGSGKKFYGLVQTTELPIKVWSADNAHECDYMLLPAERVGDYARLMAPS